jgi:F420-non-reducing hydrogenase iron-sulfur subunit
MTRTRAHQAIPSKGSASDEFSPKILGFLCNWCSYAGADLAGVSRFQYPPTLRVIRVMCSGRIDPVFVLRAFSRRVDGVMVLGCHPGDCHYTSGNYYTRNRVQVLHQLLELAEINPDRLVLDWVSAGEGQRFAGLVTDFTERIQALGPLGRNEGLSQDELGRRLATAQRVVESETVRWLVGRKREMLENGNIYGEAVAEETFEALLQSSVATEARPLSVKEMASQIGVAPQLVLPHVAVLEQAGLMAMVNIEGNSPKYQRM